MHEDCLVLQACLVLFGGLAVIGVQEGGMTTANMYSVQQSRIWAEAVEKENVTRLLWYDRTKRGDMMGESMRFEVFKKQLERNKIKDIEVRQLPPLDPKKLCRRSTKTLRRELDKTALERTERLLAKPASGPVYDMFPVSARVRDQIYEGISKDGRGRHQYLQERRRTNPESKYQFPLCSSWDYGWRLGDHVPNESIRNPEHGRRAIVESDFYTRNELPQYHRSRHLKPDDARATVLMAD